jgi:hypothetical protein
MDDIVAMDLPALEGIAAVAPGDLFDDGIRHEEKFGGAMGLRAGPAFQESERRRVQELIQAHLVDTAKEFSTDAAREVRAVDLENYHQISDKLDHGQLLSKKGRIMGDEAVQEIKKMSFFDYSRRAFGQESYLSDEEQIGHEQVCLRIVRPNRREDVGSLHADAWFWEHYNWAPPPGENRTKMWLGVCVEPELNGLRLAPGSHRRPSPYKVVNDNGKVAFAPDFDMGQIGLRKFTGKPGEPILFNYRTLHVGSLNRGKHTRVSIEVTFMYKGGQARVDKT